MNRHDYITRMILEPGISLISKECKVTLNKKSAPPTKTEILKNITGKDGVLCTVSDTIDASVLDAAGQNLKVISSYSSGYDHIDVKEATSRGIYVTFTSDIPAEATADLAFALLLACARNIVACDRFVRECRWKIGWAPTLMLGHDVYGATLGIIGLGKIGSAVARRAKGFGMQILYFDQYRNYKMESDLGVKFASLDELLEQSDFITLHTDLNSKTCNLIDESKLQKMKKTAFLINTARGQIVNEADLVKALKSKRIAGAGLDVFGTEPLPSSNPLLKLKNVIILPHIGCATYQTRSRMAAVAALNLLDVLNGRKPSPAFLVNPEVRGGRPFSPTATA